MHDRGVGFGLVVAVLVQDKILAAWNGRLDSINDRRGHGWINHEASTKERRHGDQEPGRGGQGDGQTDGPAGLGLEPLE